VKAFGRLKQSEQRLESMTCDTIWIFGYGSLMWDRWEEAHDCLRKELADLRNFHRAFNKLSVRNWGAKENPAPTLNLVQECSSNCRGMAFEFPESKRSEIMKVLRKREGGFEFSELSVHLISGNQVEASVPIYRGRNIAREISDHDLVLMAAKARGGDGTGVEYVMNIAKQLTKLEIRDAYVENFWSKLQACLPKCADQVLM
jgi:cation transport protein ChaC